MVGVLESGWGLYRSTVVFAAGDEDICVIFETGLLAGLLAFGAGDDSTEVGAVDTSVSRVPRCRLVWTIY